VVVWLCLVWGGGRALRRTAVAGLAATNQPTWQLERSLEAEEDSEKSLKREARHSGTTEGRDGWSESQQGGMTATQ
jgi:hypothetical protein